MSNVTGKGAPTIQSGRLLKAFQLSGEKRFAHPDEEEWKKIVSAAKKEKKEKG